jgi:predicted nucleic acid-binding Zn ribbon protein
MKPARAPASRPPRARQATPANRSSAAARQAVLARWRGVDLEPLEKAQALRARSAGELMPAVLQRLGLDRRRVEAEVLKVWNHAIDPTVTAHAQPTGLHKGTLFVKVDHSVWLSEIVRYRRREVLARLQHSFGREMIARISFSLG